MIRELTVNEVEDVSGGNIAAAGAIKVGGTAVASVACPVAYATKHPVAAVACGVAIVTSYAAHSYISGATAA
jgi:lactobin A/cerein 7B family class IIb bacteriocin